MDLQTRKLQFIQDFLRYANPNILSKLEILLKSEREKELEKEIEPMTLKEYEKRLEKAFEEAKTNKVKSAKSLKADIETWK